jgi:nitroreductase
VSAAVDTPAATGSAGAGPAAGHRPALDPAWYDAIASRRSRRRYSDRRVAPAALEGLRAFCESFRLAPGARVELVEGDGGVFTGLLDRFGGAYGRVEGAPWTAAFIGPKGCETEVGYVGEAFILEATRLGLGTCWVAGMFDRKTAAGLLKLHRGEHLVAVSPVGHPLERKQIVERMMSKAVRSAARRQVEEIAPGLTRGLGQAGGYGPAGAAWPDWAVSAVEAARAAPSGANRQPWRFRLQDRALVMGRAEKTYWTAPIDFGIAMLHVELGAAHEGVRGAWEHLPDPDVARFVPNGD